MSLDIIHKVTIPNINTHSGEFIYEYIRWRV